MKALCSILPLLLYINCCVANVWQGDYIIETQADADAFRSICNCTTINGNLIITGVDIVHVDSLRELKKIIGTFEIIDNPQLNNLDGLNNVTIIREDLKIHNNSSLVDLNSFNNLEYIEGRQFEIKSNESLTNITGFENLLHATTIQIESNPKLKQFTIFKKMYYFQQLLIWGNDNLTTIRELDAITEMGRFSIDSNNKLQVIGGFNNATNTEFSVEISRNPLLHTINSFKKLSSIKGNLKIYENEQLKTITGFEQLEKVGKSFNVVLSDSLVGEGYFENLKKVEDYFTTNITHFENLDSVGYMRIANDYLKIDTLTGVSGLKKIGRLVVEDNNSLTHITGFPDLRQLRTLTIQNNGSLRIIEGFNQIDSSGMYIHNNRTLRHINGFEQLKQLNGLSHTLNRNLVSMPAFDRVEYIRGNCYLTLPYNFIDQKIFKNLKRIEGELNTNVTHFHQLEYVLGINIIDDVLDNHTLSGFETVNEAGFIDIHNNKKLKHIHAFTQLEKADIKIYENENLLSVGGFNKIDTIYGDLYIAHNSSLKDISGFENLNYLGGDFNCQVNPSLITVNSFNKLTKVKDFVLHFNNSLQEISGFENLKSADHILIGDNLRLTSVSLFNNLSQITEFIRIQGNLSLENIPEFNNLCTLNYIDINSNLNLQKIEGFKKLKNVNEIRIILNNNLISIQGFNQLSSLPILNVENRNLRSLNAFNNLKAIDELSLTNNIHLRSIDNFSTIGTINKLTLQYNIQMNECCLINCWLNEDIIDPLDMIVTNNGTDCSGMEVIKNTCEESPCNKREESLSNLNVSYNLANDMVQFNFIIYEDQLINYSIFNINDQIVYKDIVESQRGVNLKTVNIPDLQKGYHFLLMKNGETKSVAKFMKM